MVGSGLIEREKDCLAAEILASAQADGGAGF